jgi:pilus assembly protein FimV
MALDIDFDMPAPAVAEAAAPVPASVTETSADPQFESTIPGVPAAELVAPAVAESAVDGGIDFALDVDLPTVAVEPRLPEVAADVPAVAVDTPIELPAVESSLDSIDFEFDLGDKAPLAPAELPTQASGAEETVRFAAPLDLGAISLDLDLPDTAAVEVPDTPDLATASGPEFTASDSNADNPEAATKLELALAYEEMGDRDGARELLDEVVKEGSPAQRDQAQAKLATLG